MSHSSISSFDEFLVFNAGDFNYQFHQHGRTQRRDHSTDGMLRIRRVRDAVSDCNFRQLL